MNNDKKIWLLEQYMNKTWALSLMLAQEAARAGQHGRGYAVIAEESRNLYGKIFSYVSEIRFGSGESIPFRTVSDIAVMMKFLSINAEIECSNMTKVSMEYNIPKSIAVYAAELRAIAGDVNALAENPVWDAPFTVPEFADYADSDDIGGYFCFTVGGHQFIENMKNIALVCYPDKPKTAHESFTFQGQTVPFLDLYNRFSLTSTGYSDENQTVLLLRVNRDNGAEDTIAVSVDDVDVNAILYSRAGKSVAPERTHAFADYARDCWDAVGGGQFVFADWGKLLP